ncbi:MAG: imidazoleglycerol-phosphate dehydratase HisB [Christensenellaceae bacterium]|jgi:imidazoleglycerol-phosphate dehydratase|nr:imidazoleglycerol-phosphate dehydratase HisB [Christensenellaceae bacterium]
MRITEISRKTKETDIKLTLNLDGCGIIDIATGIGFFDHMLTAFATHASFDLSLFVKGDLHVDCHHTVEDVGIILGQAINKALGEKRGINRFSNIWLPMDEAMAFAAIDISGRGFCLFEALFSFKNCGDYENDATCEFMRALATNSLSTLHVKAMYGENDHHINEAIYKAVARCYKTAVAITGNSIPSSKGSL